MEAEWVWETGPEGGENFWTGYQWGVNGEHGDGAVVNGGYANWGLDHLSPPEYVADIDQDYAAMMLKTDPDNYYPG